MLRLLTVVFALLQLSSGLQLSGVRANVQLRRSVGPVMGVTFKVGDTVQMITGDSKGAPACMRLEAALRPHRAPAKAALRPKLPSQPPWRLPRLASLLPLSAAIHGCRRAASCLGGFSTHATAWDSRLLYTLCKTAVSRSKTPPAPSLLQAPCRLADSAALRYAQPLATPLRFRRPGESGKVIAVDTKGRKLTIEGINMQTKHVKPMKGTRPAHALMRWLPRTHGPAASAKC